MNIEASLFWVAIAILVIAVFIYVGRENAVSTALKDQLSLQKGQIETLRTTIRENAKECREDLDGLKQAMERLATTRHFLDNKMTEMKTDYEKNLDALLDAVEASQRKAETAETLAHQANLGLARLPKNEPPPDRIYYEITLVDGGKKPKESLSVKGQDLDKLKKKTKELSQ